MEGGQGFVWALGVALVALWVRANEPHHTTSAWRGRQRVRLLLGPPGAAPQAAPLPANPHSASVSTRVSHDHGTPPPAWHPNPAAGEALQAARAPTSTPIQTHTRMHTCRRSALNAPLTSAPASAGRLGSAPAAAAAAAAATAADAPTAATPSACARAGAPADSAVIAATPGGTTTARCCCCCWPV